MSHRIVCTCGRGAADIVAGEVQALGLPVLAREDTAVVTAGGFADALRLNLHLRAAHRVLLGLTGFHAENADELYARAAAFPWEEHLYPDRYLTVGSSVENETIRDPRFATLRLKDAVVDRLRRATGRRPDTGGERTGAAVFLFWRGRRADLFLDTSGAPLSHRGYRVEPWKAPMRETLAAACLLATSWRGGGALVNPMCGSGTVAIEGALLATGRAPGLLRRDFAFRHVRAFREKEWKELRAAATAAARPRPAAPIVATDIHPRAVEAARRNAARAGVDGLIEFAVADFRDTPVPAPPGLIFFNPDYGERLGDAAELEPLYKGIGDFLKQRGAGYTGCVFTGNRVLAKMIGLRSRRRVALFNGDIECRLLEFELYPGTKDPGPSSVSRGPGQSSNSS